MDNKAKGEGGLVPCELQRVISCTRHIFILHIPISIFRFTLSHLNLFIAVTKLSAELHARKFGAMKREKKRSSRGERCRREE